MNTTLQSIKDDHKQKNASIYLVEEDEDKAVKLLLLLTDANYAVRLFAKLNDFIIAIEGEKSPAAIIIGPSFQGSEKAGIATISKIKQDRPTLPPVIFISTNDDMPTRLAAVRAGGEYFLTEPLDQNALFTALDDSLVDKKKTSPHHVLIIDDTPERLRYYNEKLNDTRLVLKTLSQPLNTLSTLQHFNADVIVISLSMANCSGLELREVIRQHLESMHTPVIFLYSRADDLIHLEAANTSDDAFYSETIEPEHLTQAIIARAKGSRSQKQLDQQLQLSLDRSEFYHSAMDQHNIVSITDIGGRITDVNDQFCKISGYPREELIGRNHRLIKSRYHDKALYEDMWRTISEGKVWHGEICNLTKRGREYWVSSTIVPFLDRKGKPWQYISVRTDITALRVSEDRLHRAQNFANIGSWDWDICTDELYWSDRIGPLFGHPPGEIETTFKNFQTSIHPDDLPLVNLAIEDCIEHGLEYNVEHRIIWPDGSVHWAHECGDAIRNSRGDAMRMLGVVQDITRRKEIELGLQEEQRRLKEAQQIGAIGDWKLEFGDNQLIYSDEALRIADLQSSDRQLSLEQTLEKFDPEDRKAMAIETRNAIKHGQSKIDVRIYPDKDTLRWVQVAQRAIRDKKGNTTGFRGTLQDITERKETEQIQQHSNLILQNIAKDAPLTDTLTLLIEQAESTQADRFGAVLIVDPHSGQLYCGAAPSLPESIGSTLEQIKADVRPAAFLQNIINDISNHADWQSFRDAYTQAGFMICCARTIQSSSDILLGVLLMYSTKPHQPSSSCALLTNELARFTAIALEQKRVLWSLMEAKEEAVKANQAKTQFLSRISHDLRTPLNAIVGFGQLLNMDKSSPLSLRQRISVGEINNASEHLLELINEILNLSQIESGHIELHFEAINIYELIAECEALISPLAKERNITVTIPGTENSNSHLPTDFIEADRKRLKQILLNLLSNAVKYNRQGGNIDINCESTDKYLRILVTDTGEGLTKAQQELLFSAFERLGAEHSSIEGSGIGLVIAKGLVENMAGSIGVESEPDKGSTFWIKLPKAPKEPRH